jgi:Protein of unknown function (DUF3105)
VTLRRAGAIVLAVVVALGGAIGLLALLDARDSARVRRPAAAGPGAPVPGGAPAGISPALRRDLARGDVVFLYGSPQPPAGLRALAEEVQDGPADPSLVAAGQAVLVARQPGTTGVVALAWSRRLRARSPTDPALRRFAETWLGRGAP